MRTILTILLLIINISLASAGQTAKGTATAMLTSSLYIGDVAAAQAKLERYTRDTPADQEGLYALGVAQFVRAIERLGQALYRYSLESLRNGLDLPFLRFPVPSNPNPEKLSFEKFRAILQDFIADLETADVSLVGVNDAQVSLPINIGLVRLDLNDDGKAESDEALWRVFSRISRQQISETQATTFLLHFDAGDAAWMRGYSHLLRAMAEFLLAHNWEASFEHAFHRFFPRSGLPFSSLDDLLIQQQPLWDDVNKCQRELPANQSGCWEKRPKGVIEPSLVEGADLVAFIHLMHWQVSEPKRMERVLSHLQNMVSMSRQSWKSILAETDNNNEWIPSPAQTSLLAGMGVTQEIIDGWLSFLDQFDSLLQGKLLVGHWRLAKGINLRRVFLEPQPFDPVLWFQGSAAIPYLEDGPLAQGDTLRRFQQIFQGNFFSYAIWLN